MWGFLDKEEIIQAYLQDDVDCDGLEGVWSKLSDTLYTLILKETLEEAEETFRLAGLVPSGRGSFTVYASCLVRCDIHSPCLRSWALGHRENFAQALHYSNNHYFTGMNLQWDELQVM